MTFEINKIIHQYFHDDLTFFSFWRFPFEFCHLSHQNRARNIRKTPETSGIKSQNGNPIENLTLLTSFREQMWICVANLHSITFSFWISMYTMCEASLPITFCAITFQLGVRFTWTSNENSHYVFQFISKTTSSNRIPCVDISL